MLYRRGAHNHWGLTTPLRRFCPRWRAITCEFAVVFRTGKQYCISSLDG